MRREEAAYCREHPVYFVEKYVHIEDKDAPGLLVPFELWPGQKKALEAFAGHRLNVVLKARQLGLTWLALAEAARLLALEPGRTVVGLSRSEEEAKELVRRLGVILRGMPEFIAVSGQEPPGWDGPVFKITALSVAIDWPDAHQGAFRAFASGPSVGRSFTADLMLIDEWAFQQFAQEIWASAFPVVNRPTGGRVIGLSTIRRGTLFEELYTDPDNGFCKIFLPWDTDPRRDQHWYRRTLAALGPDRTRQEYPATQQEALEVPGGAFFPEVRMESHWIDTPPQGPVRRYVSLDYGLDMLSVKWVAIDPEGRAVVYRELDEPNKTIGEAAELVLRLSRGEEIEQFLAPGDLWGRSQESGKCRAQLFAEAGLYLVKVSRDFAAGCAAMKEWLRVDPVTGTPRMRFCDTPTVYRHLQKIQKDPNEPDVYAKTPHILTHAVDSLRYFCIWWTSPAGRPAQAKVPWEPDLLEDFERADEEGKAHLIALYGEPG